MMNCGSGQSRIVWWMLPPVSRLIAIWIHATPMRNQAKAISAKRLAAGERREQKSQDETVKKQRVRGCPATADIAGRGLFEGVAGRCGCGRLRDRRRSASRTGRRRSAADQENGLARHVAVSRWKLPLKVPQWLSTL